MSDISLRFDGLILFAAMALGALAYLLIAAVAMARAAIDRRLRRRLARAARRAGLLAVVSAFLATLVWRDMDRRGMAIAGPDWIDFGAIPYAAVFAAGCWWLARPPGPPGPPA